MWTKCASFFYQLNVRFYNQIWSLISCNINMLFSLIFRLPQTQTDKYSPHCLDCILGTICPFVQCFLWTCVCFSVQVTRLLPGLWSIFHQMSCVGQKNPRTAQQNGGGLAQDHTLDFQKNHDNKSNWLPVWGCEQAGSGLAALFWRRLCLTPWRYKHEPRLHRHLQA